MNEPKSYSTLKALAYVAWIEDVRIFSCVLLFINHMTQTHVFQIEAKWFQGGRECQNVWNSKSEDGEAMAHSMSGLWSLARWCMACDEGHAQVDRGKIPDFA